MALDRTFSETHGGLAVLHILQGRLDIAEPEVKRALRLDPKCFSGRFAQSLLLSKSDPAQAQAIVQGIMSSSVIEGERNCRTSCSGRSSGRVLSNRGNDAWSCARRS